MGHQLQPVSGAQHCARPNRGHFGGSKGDAARQGVRNLVSRLSPYSNPTSASALVNCVVQDKFIILSGVQFPICNTGIPVSQLERIK